MIVFCFAAASGTSSERTIAGIATIAAAIIKGVVKVRIFIKAGSIHASSRLSTIWLLFESKL
jgi:hypothetical protein